MLVTFLKMIFRDMELVNGLIKKNMKDNGIKIKCTEEESSLGQLVNGMKENLKMINLMDMEDFNGQMVSHMLEIGKMERWMGKEH